VCVFVKVCPASAAALMIHASISELSEKRAIPVMYGRIMSWR